MLLVISRGKGEAAAARENPNGAKFASKGGRGMPGDKSEAEQYGRSTLEKCPLVQVSSLYVVLLYFGQRMQRTEHQANSILTARHEFMQHSQQLMVGNQLFPHAPPWHIAEATCILKRARA
jgi:hypothetical protein